MLHIITPCFKPQNLPAIGNSIPREAKWTIAHNKQKIPKEINASIIKCSTNDISDSLNYVLDKVSFKDNDCLLYLLDDNIVHPNLYSTVSDMLSKDFSIMQWGQIFKDGIIRLPPVPYCVPGSMNEATFLVKWKYNRSVRFDKSRDLFFNYALACYNNGPYLMINNYISYYKYLGE